MQAAYDKGLPSWNDVKAVYDQYADQWITEKAAGAISEEVSNARNKVLAMVEVINEFIRYHFQDNSVFADHVVETGEYPTACSDTLGIRRKINVGGANDQLVINDRTGQTVTINANDAGKLSNVLTRDYVFTGHEISTSSFATIHEIDKPLNTHREEYNAQGDQIDSDRYDFKWTGPNATARLKYFRKKFESSLWRRYIEN